MAVRSIDQMYVCLSMIGRQRDHDVVHAAPMKAVKGGRALNETLLEVPEVEDGLTEDGLDRLLDPEAYTGLAADFVDRVLAACETR